MPDTLPHYPGLGSQWKFPHLKKKIMMMIMSLVFIKYRSLFNQYVIGSVLFKQKNQSTFFFLYYLLTYILQIMFAKIININKKIDYSCMLWFFLV